MFQDAENYNPRAKTVASIQVQKGIPLHYHNLKTVNVKSTAFSSSSPARWLHTLKAIDVKDEFAM